MLLAAGAAGILVVVGIFLALSSGPGSAPGLSVPDEGRAHVADGALITYAHYPPASGPHYAKPEPWGVYSTAVAEGSWVHNLEHGGIVLLYKCAGDECKDIASQISAISSRLPKSKSGSTKLVAFPYDKTDSPFTLVAWNRQEALSALDGDKIAAFYRAFVDRGPEDAP